MPSKSDPPGRKGARPQSEGGANKTLSGKKASLPARTEQRATVFAEPEESTRPGPGEALKPARPAAAVGSHLKTNRLSRPDLIDGRYELEKLISKGGMGRVFRGRHRELGREVALKLVLDGSQHDLEMRERFYTEARLSSALNHPNIVTVTDFGVDENLGFYLAMELLEGDTLRQRMRKGRLSVRLALELLEQIVDAVEYIHARGIVHCDLKPENIFLAQVAGRSDSLVVKLLDFGLSLRREAIPSSDPNEVMGTPPYLAPERYAGSPTSPACDIYSLGAIFYELIAHRLPYEGATAQEIIQKQLHRSMPPPPSGLAEERLDPRIDELILRALSRDPARRHPTVTEFHEELRMLMSKMGIGEPRPAVLESSMALGGEVVKAMVLESPLPLAIVALSGTLRFCNHSFLVLAGVSEGRSPERFDGFPLVASSPELADGLREVARTGQVCTVRVSLPSGQSLTAYFAPSIRHDRIDNVHVTLLPGPAPK